MIKNKIKHIPLFNGIFIFAALMILTDFIFPGRVWVEDILAVKREQQQYYNAARNYHYSHKVITTNHQFWVSKDFAQLVKKDQKVEFSVSPIFKEVNWHRLPEYDRKAIYSLRIISGLVIPILIILSIGVAYQYSKKISTLIFVLQIILIADLIFLIM